MLSLREVRHAASVLQSLLAGARLQRIVQPDEFRLVMEFYRQGDSHIVLFSCRPPFARISLMEEMPRAPQVPPAFVQYARAHLLNTAFVRVATEANDRRLGILVGPQDGSYELMLSILGPRSNIYLLDPNRNLVCALRPLAETRRALALGRPWINPEGMPRSEGEDRWAGSAEAAYLREIEKTYAGLEKRAAAEALAGRVAGALAKETDSLERKAVNLQQDLGDALQGEAHRNTGELLKTVLHLIQPGSESITAGDFESGAPVVIPLDPRLSPAENLEAHFKRCQKELRGAKILREQLARLRGLQAEISGYRQRLDAITRTEAPDGLALQSLAAEPRVRKLLARFFPERRPKAARAPMRAGGSEIPGRLRPRRFRTDRGLEIWVGRSEEGNDYLTTRLARGNDLFFHLEGYPGSHVILRTEGKTDPAPASILDACELAVHFSRLKDAQKADVHVAPVKNVRKPKGAKPGLVYVTGGKTVHLRRDPARLENILSARLDE
jgi:predicted ribosome quality control (RQC) complex YloA/Tae2 family protein